MCGSKKDEVNKLIRGKYGYICDSCISIASDLLNDEEEENITNNMQLATPSQIKAHLDQYVIGQDELMKVALCGVKYIKCVADIERENQRLDANYNTPFAIKENGFNLIDALYGIIGRIKLNNLIKIFPIDKEYDGDKWGCKDYFFTMDVLKKKGLDNAVGRDEVFDLMWDYMNKDLREFTVFYMSCMSAMYQCQTGVTFMDKFCEDNNIDSYSVDRENGIIVNNQTGKFAKLSNKPSFMQIVK